MKKGIKDVQTVDLKGNEIVVKDVSVSIDEKGEVWIRPENVRDAMIKQYGKEI